MKKFLLLLFILLSTTHYGQCLSQIRIIYETKDNIIMNNGQQYKILDETSFYSVLDVSVKKHIHVFDNQTLNLSRLLVLKSNTNYTELIEWIKGTKKYYEYRDLEDNFELEANQISDSRK